MTFNPMLVPPGFIQILLVFNGRDIRLEIRHGSDREHSEIVCEMWHHWEPGIETKTRAMHNFLLKHGFQCYEHRGGFANELRYERSGA